MNPEPELLWRASDALRTHPHADVDVDELILEVLGKAGGDRRMEYVRIELENLGVVEPTPFEGRFRFVRPLEAGEVDPSEAEAKHKRDLGRLLDVVNLTKAPDLRAYALGYFDLE